MGSTCKGASMIIVFKLMALVVFLMSALSLVYVNSYNVFPPAQSLVLSAGFAVALVYGILGAIRSK
jgi:hypothetical protein